MQEVIVPVQTKISDKRVVKIYNAAIILTTVVAGLFFVFAWKSWAITTPVVVGANMWVHSSSIVDSSIPEYCNNAKYDYIYSDSWKYINASCSKPEVDKVFLKGPGMPGSFWVSTFFSHKLHQIEKCYNSHMNLSCSGGDRTFQIGTATNEYVHGVESYVLSSQLSLLIPKLSYDGRTAPKSPRVIAIKPDGKVVELSHTKLIIQKTIHEWIELFGLESLDATSEELNNLYGVGGDTGDVRLRFTGVNLFLDIEVANHKNLFDVPQDIFVTLHLSSDLNWQRTVLSAIPTSTDRVIRTTNAYGIRFVWRVKETNVLVFDAARAAITVLDVLVFFHVTEIICVMIFMKCFGADSKKWNHARRKHINNHIDVDKKLIGQSALSSATSSTKTGALVHPATKKVNLFDVSTNEIAEFVNKIFPRFDGDKDGALNAKETKALIEVLTDQHISTDVCNVILMSIDDNDNAMVEPDELVEFIGGGLHLIFDNKRKQRYIARSPAHKIIVDFFAAVYLRIKYGRHNKASRK